MRGSRMLTFIVLGAISLGILPVVSQNAQGDPLGTEIYLVLTNGPDGNDIDSMMITTMAGLEIFASAYYTENNSYAGCVDVNWTLSDPGVGSIDNTSGTSTTFTAGTQGGTTIINGTSDALEVSDEAQLGVLPPQIDFICIRSEPYGGGENLSDPAYYPYYQTGEIDVLWGASYNSSSGYLGDLTSGATWISNDTNVATVDPFGASTTLMCNTTEGMTDIILFDSFGNIAKTTITVLLQPPSVDSIVISDTPGDAGNWFSSGIYKSGDKQTMYAAGYNDSYGYLGEKNVTWYCNNTSVGTVNTSGSSTIFEALSQGTCFVWIELGGVINATGTITVVGVEEIVIRSAPGGGGLPISHDMFFIKESTYFYAAAYADLFGFLGDVPVLWMSSNPSVGNVTGSGSSTKFKAVGKGTCVVTAVYQGGVLNTTGTLTVINYELDYIKILDFPQGLGFPVGERLYDIGESDVFYAAGFNLSAGYIGDVEVIWSSNNSQVCSVSSPGNITSVTTTGSGICVISAYYNAKITASTGLIKIALVDEIRILEAAEHESPIVGEREYNVGDQDTFWAVGYNNTYGYLGAQNVTWTSSNSAVAQVDPLGSYTVFSSLWIGSCTIKASHPSGVFGFTGNLTVKLPSIIIVDDDGDAHFSSISEAIKYAKSQDTILVHKGIYHEHIVIDKPLFLIGEDKVNCIIKGGSDGSVITIASDDIVVGGFTVSGGEKGIVCSNTDNVEITNNIIKESLQYGIYAISGYTLSIANNTIDTPDNYLRDSNITRLWIENTLLTLHNCTIDDLRLDETSILLYEFYLSITVVDEDNEPVSYAVVSLRDTHDNHISIHVADQNGNLSLDSVISGVQNHTTLRSYLPISVLVSKEFYGTGSHILNSSQDSTVRIILKKEAVPVRTPKPAFPWAMVLMIGFIGAMAAFGAGSILIEILKFGLISLFVPLYTRLKRSDILNQPIRERIYGYILGNPGANYGMIKQDLGLPNGQLVHHLRQLMDAHMIYSKKDGIKKRFFPVEFPRPKGPIFYLTETQKKILGLIKKVSGMTQREIAKTTGISRQVAYYHLSKLEQQGLITKEIHGTKRRYYPCKESSQSQ